MSPAQQETSQYCQSCNRVLASPTDYAVWVMEGGAGVAPFCSADGTKYSAIHNSADARLILSTMMDCDNARDLWLIDTIKAKDLEIAKLTKDLAEQAGKPATGSQKAIASIAQTLTAEVRKTQNELALLKGAVMEIPDGHEPGCRYGSWDGGGCDCTLPEDLRYARKLVGGR